MGTHIISVKGGTEVEEESFKYIFTRFIENQPLRIPVESI